MRWKGETFDQTNERLANWHLWYAWHPVQTPDGMWHWLEYVERREVDRGYGAKWEYRNANL